MATEKTPSGHGSQKPFERKAPDVQVEQNPQHAALVKERTAPGGAGPGPIAKPAAKPVEKKPETLVGPMLLSDVQAALSDRYPHNDIHELEGATIEVKVPGGVILVDCKAVNKCKNTAELRAYIDALPIQ